MIQTSCDRCFKKNFNEFKLYFVFCMQQKENETCDDCQFWMKTIDCFMRKRFHLLFILFALQYWIVNSKRKSSQHKIGCWSALFNYFKINNVEKKWRYSCESCYRCQHFNDCFVAFDSSKLFCFRWISNSTINSIFFIVIIFFVFTSAVIINWKKV